MAKTSKRGVTLTDGGSKPKHYVPGNANVSKKKKNKKKSNDNKRNVKPKIDSESNKKPPSQKMQVFNLFAENKILL